MGLVKPEKPSFVPFTGVVTAVNDGVVTVESPDGDVQTLALPGDLGEVALGEVVTVFKKGSGKVTGLVKADQVRKRLNKFLEAASNEEGDEESSQDTDQRSRRADALARTLENFGARHLEVLNRVGGRVQEAVKRQIEIIKAKVKSDRRNSRAIIERVKKKLRVGHGESEPPGHGDRQPEAKGKPTENVDGEKGNRGRGAEKEDGSGTTSPKRPATPGVPRVDSQGDTEGRDAPEDGKRRGSSGKGKNR